MSKNKSGSMSDAASFFIGGIPPVIDAKTVDPVSPPVPVPASKPAKAKRPSLVEKKTARLNLLIKPSVLEKLKEKALEDGRSVNDYINRLIEKDIAE